MTTLSVYPVEQPGFSFEPRYTHGALTLRIAGNADMNAQATLAACLKQVHAEALRLGVNEVVCELGELYFMSSSCFKAFVTWVTNIVAVEPNKQYRIRLRRNRQLEWQRRSVEALRCLADKIVVVDA